MQLSVNVMFEMNVVWIGDALGPLEVFYVKGKQENE